MTGNPEASPTRPVAEPSRMDVLTVRADFPILATTVHGRPLAYLDNAATTQKPRQVLEAVLSYYRTENANVHRGVHFLSERATEAYENAREKVRRFIGAEQRSEIIFVRGCTEAINLVAGALGRALPPGKKNIVLSEMEHHSNIVPWQLLAESTGMEIRVIPVLDSGELDVESLDRLVDRETAIVSLVFVSNSLGTCNPVQQVVDLAHGRGVPVLLDAAQAVPHVALDVREIGCDFLAFSGHKVYGPMGIGVLYGRRELLESMPPYQGGGDMIRTVSFSKTTYADPPARFEAGTPNVAGAVGLGVAVDYVTSVGLDRIAKHEAALLRYGTRLLSEIPGVVVIGTAPNKVGSIAFVLEGVHAHDIGSVLDSLGVAIRAGHHCTQPVMRRFGLSATARISFAMYNTREEIETAAAGVHKARELFGLGSAR